MKAFFIAYAERKAAQATAETDAHINKENAMLAATQRWENKQKNALNKLTRARALLLGITDPERVAELAVQHNKSAIIRTDALPSAWLNFNITDNPTEFYVPDGRDGVNLLETAMKQTAKKVLNYSSAPNPLCIRMRDIRLHLTQVGRAFHLKTSSELEPHEVELECREHMHSWSRMVADYHRIQSMAAATNGKAKKEWDEWIERKDPYTDPPTLAFNQESYVADNLNIEEFLFLQYTTQERPDAAAAYHLDLSNSETQFFIGSTPTDAEAVYYMAHDNPSKTFYGFVFSAFELDCRVLRAAIKRKYVENLQIDLDAEKQQLYHCVAASSNFDSPLVARLILNVRTAYGPESFCCASIQKDETALPVPIYTPLPEFDAAKTLVIQEIVARGISEDDAKEKFKLLTVFQKASALHAAGVVRQYATRSTAFADPRGLKLAKRRLVQLITATLSRE